MLITIDTLRRDSLSCYGKRPSSHTPNIDRLAEDGLVIKKAISSSSWTVPSLTSIMTGLPVEVHGVDHADSRVPEVLKTLAEYMLEAGYFTGAIGSQLLMSPRYNLLQGFQHYNTFPKTRPMMLGSKVLRKLRAVIPLDPLPSSLRYRLSRALSGRATTSDLTHLAVQWLEANQNRDFFFWLHYFDPHQPYAPPASFVPEGVPPLRIGNRFHPQVATQDGTFDPLVEEKEWIRKLYDAEVRYVDHNVGQVLDALKEKRLYDKSLIIITSDHGEEFWEHDGIGHGHTLYNELLWVPLIIKVPDSIGRLGEINTTVSTLSILPTVNRPGISGDSIS